MACSSPRTPGGKTRKAGIAGGMGSITTSNHGARFSNGRRSRSWSTTIAHRGYRSSDSPGLQACGGDGGRDRRLGPALLPPDQVLHLLAQDALALLELLLGADQVKRLLPGGQALEFP